MTLEKKNEQLEIELDALNDRFLRLAADFQNYKRNKEQEIEKIQETACEKVVTDLLFVIDDVKRALEYQEDEAFELLYNKLIKVLGDNGAELYGAPGEEFNFELHEAVCAYKKESIKPGTILSVINQGCKLNGKIIRFAKVSVSS